MAQPAADDDHRVEEELQEAFARMFTEEESPRAQDWINWLDEVRGTLCFRMLVMTAAVCADGGQACAGQ
jgi:hypothetical protein